MSTIAKNFAKWLCPCLHENSDDDESSPERTLNPRSPFLPQRAPSRPSHVCYSPTGVCSPSIPHVHLILDAESGPHPMPPRRTYGSKRSTAAKGAAAIFGNADARSPVTRSQVGTQGGAAAIVGDPDRLSVPVIRSRARIQDRAPIFGNADARSPVTRPQARIQVQARAQSPVIDLEDLASRLANTRLEVVIDNSGPSSPSSGSSESDEYEQSRTLSSEAPSPSPSPDSSEDSDEDSEDPTENSASSPSPSPSPSPISPFLAADIHPLTSAYQTDRGTPLHPVPWSTILPPNTTSTLQKIAEASYAEVYRITVATTPVQTSILKILHLALPYDPASLSCPTAIPLTTVISEIRIMNALTSVPGFVTFKEAHLVQGKPTPPFTQAYERWENEEKNYSNFPHPSKYSDRSLFLVLELGDAGTVLEDWKIESVDEVWDIFLGVVMALAKAETSNEFEHRDLHENNICIRPHPKKDPTSSPCKRTLPQKYGFSGLEITIIDYGLSRAKLGDGTVVFNDLEYDLAIFQGRGQGVPAMQFDCYRRMRSYLLTGSRKSKPLSWHSTSLARLESNDELSLLPTECDPITKKPLSPWSTHTPYSSSLWLRFLLYYLTHHFTQLATNQPSHRSPPSLHLKTFLAETTELKRRLDVRTKPENGAFGSAGDVLSYCFEMGWVAEEDLGVEGSFVSRVSGGGGGDDGGEESILGV